MTVKHRNKVKAIIYIKLVKNGQAHLWIKSIVVVVVILFFWCFFVHHKFSNEYNLSNEQFETNCSLSWLLRHFGVFLIIVWVRWFQKSDGPKKEICGCLPTFWPIKLHFYGPVKLKKIGIALVDSYSACSDGGS